MNIFKSTTLALCLLFNLLGCASPPTPGNKTISKQHSYTPQNRQQFVFKDKNCDIARVGECSIFNYRNFCTEDKPYSCRKTLPYMKYMGIKGYFETNTPSWSNSTDSFYPVVLANGEKWFYQVKKSSKHRLEDQSQIIPYQKHSSMQSRIGENLVANSNIKINKVFSIADNLKYELNSGHRINDEQLKYIRLICSKYPGESNELAELLLETRFQKDNMNDQLFILPKTTKYNATELAPYIGIKNTNVWLRFKLFYYSGKWVFADSFKVATDDFRWQSPNYEFKRDHDGGMVWEWIDVPMSDELLRVTQKVSDSSDTTIRFQGNPHSFDKTISREQRNYIRTILKIYAIMKN